jgi:hypothetical protein
MQATSTAKDAQIILMDAYINVDSGSSVFDVEGIKH